MLICSVCRSQNMDTAKFCGNCGSPFAQASNSVPASPGFSSSAAATAASSSLINCPQGHIYSSVYQTCPYCPQYDSGASEYATRVEEPGAPITAVDLPINDFGTRTAAETLFETVEPPAANQSGNTSQSPVLTPTEVISAVNLNEPNIDRMTPPEMRRSISEVP